MHSLSVCNHSLTYELKSNTVGEIKARTSPTNAAPRLSTMLAEALSFYLTGYQTQSKGLSRFKVSSRWKYETDIASFSTSNPKMFFAHFRKKIIHTTADLSPWRRIWVLSSKSLNHRQSSSSRSLMPSSALAPGNIPERPFPWVMMGFPVLTSCFAHSTSDICKNQGPDELPP